jgi:hypothetical protein
MLAQRLATAAQGEQLHNALARLDATWPIERLADGFG